MVDHWCRVVGGEGSSDRRWLGEAGRRCIAKLRDPAFDIVARGIVALGLRPWVLDPEVRRGVGAGARAPLPAAVVAGDFSIDEMTHVPAFAVHPPKMEVLGQE